jgi:hypothetical protein
MKVAVFDNVFNITKEANVSSLTFGTTSTNLGDTVQILSLVDGTSQAISGNFTLTFRGDRSIYIPYNADARTLTTALEDLDTIGQVDVTRSVADENNGYTWTVTFLTELGSLDYLEFDGADMTGTVVTGTVAKYVTGIAPPFNSLDTSAGLPLGSAIVTDLTDMALTVSSLSQGVPYYFRVSAINAIGQGSAAYSSTPYAIPQLQRPGRPLSDTLTVIDGSTLQVAFNSPTLNGGAAVTFYKVLNYYNCFTDYLFWNEKSESYNGFMCFSGL